MTPAQQELVLKAIAEIMDNDRTLRSMMWISGEDYKIAGRVVDDLLRDGVSLDYIEVRKLVTARRKALA